VRLCHAPESGSGEFNDSILMEDEIQAGVEILKAIIYFLVLVRVPLLLLLRGFSALRPSIQRPDCLFFRPHNF
jgi:hypothetical protein